MTACENRPVGFMPLDSPIRSQNDVGEFFTHLLDALSSVFPAPGGGDIWSRTLQGFQVTQILPQSCDHVKAKRDAFLCLQVGVADTIEKALASTCQDEMLSGDNAVLCEACGTKKDTQMRSMLAADALPDTLVISLKRFEMDWNTNSKIKVNDVCRFGFDLDLWPYTDAGIAEREGGGGGGARLPPPFLSPPVHPSVLTVNMSFVELSYT